MSHKNSNHWTSKLFLSKESAEEQQAVENWRDQLKSNIENMQSAIENEQGLDHLHGYQTVNKNAAWENISSQIDLKEKAPKNQLGWTRIAAAIAFVVFSIIAFRYFVSNPSNSFVPKTYQFVEATKFSLPDDSKILLRGQSQLIESGFRQTKLSGRAYFDISPDKAHPFTISLYHGDITVVGTEFDIITSSDFTQIYVTEGKVLHRFDGQEYILEVGDLLTISNNGIQKIKKVDIQVDAWHSNKLVFTNESMVNVLYSVASMYQKQLIFDLRMSSSSDNCKINTKFMDESLEKILLELSTIAGLKYQITKDQIIIKSFKC